MFNIKKINIMLMAGLLLFILISDSFPQDIKNTSIGPLEVSLTRANLVLVHGGGVTDFKPTIRLRIVNVSVSDTKIILFKYSINVTDNLGEALFEQSQINSSGILLSEKAPNYFGQAFNDERGKFITLAPKQSFEAQISTNSYRRIRDNGEFFRRHRPLTIDFSATLGIINVDNSTEMRGLSFPQVPVLVTTR